MSVSGAVQGTAAERATGVVNDPATPVVQRSGAAAVVVDGVEAITPASGSELGGEQGKHAENLEIVSAGLTGGSKDEDGTPAAETPLGGTKSPSTAKPEGTGREVRWESLHGLEKQAAPARPSSTPAVAVVTAGEGDTLVAELPSEAKPTDFEAHDVRADSSSESTLAAENDPLSPSNQAGASQAAAIGHDRVKNSVPGVVGGEVAPTEEGITPTGERENEKKAPTEDAALTEGAAPTEERGRAGSPIGFSSLERHREEQVKNENTPCTYRIVRLESW